MSEVSTITKILKDHKVFKMRVNSIFIIPMLLNRFYKYICGDFWIQASKYFELYTTPKMLENISQSIQSAL